MAEGEMREKSREMDMLDLEPRRIVGRDVPQGSLEPPSLHHGEGHDESANERQSKILDSQSSGIMCQSKILLCDTSWIMSDVIQLLWQTSAGYWQSSGLLSDKTAVVWQSKILGWQSSGIMSDKSGITSDSSEML